MNQINFSSVACGDTIWVAGGNYSTTLTAAKNCSSGSPLTINRVLASDSTPAAAAGWSRIRQSGSHCQLVWRRRYSSQRDH